MNLIWVYSILSVVIVSLVSLIGVFALGIKVEKLKKILILLLAFSAGALLGDAFIHLLPEVVSKAGFGLSVAIYVLLGILMFFILEKVIQWQHCHMPVTKDHVHSFAKMNLIGDSLHNFIDGLIIAASYMINIPTGIATSIAVVVHEIPQEIGDFGILLHGGYTKGKALLLNLGTALIAVLGAIVALWLGNVEGIEVVLTGIAAGGFIYIAGSDLIPEMHKETKISNSLAQVIAFIIGILVMVALILLE
jgi:zinc and cadmium transporter